MCEQDSCGAQDKLSNSDEATLPDDLSLSDSDPEEEEEEPASVPFDPEVIDLSDSDDEDEDEDDDGLQICGDQDRPPSAPGQRAVPGLTQSPFSLRGGSSSFSSRSRSIFDCLDSAAKLASSQLGQDNVIDGVFARPPPPPPLTSSKAPGEQRGGQPPQGGPGAAAGGRREVPDYLVHPERWTCYSLEDVAETSDSQNSAVAQQYIHSLQQRKEPEIPRPEEEEEPFVPTFNQGQTDRSSSQHKIIFSRPSQAAGRDPAAAEPKASVGGTEKGKGLSHLEDDEDEEEEEEDGTRLDAADEGKDQSKELEKGEEKERAGGVGRVEREGVEEQDGTAAVVEPQKAEPRKRRWGQQARSEEKETDEKKTNTGFVSFRKINRKNYRRTSDHKED